MYVSLLLTARLVVIDDTEIAMTVLCGLSEKYEHLIVAIDAVADDDTLTMDFVKRRLLQDEQRILDRGDVNQGRDAALVNSPAASASDTQPRVCVHCGKKGHFACDCPKRKNDNCNRSAACCRRAI